MRTATHRACLAVGVLVSTFGAASGKVSGQTLIARWLAQNSLCRGLPGDDPRSIAACEKRQAIGRELGHLGWCYGKRDQMAYQMQWHRCEADSLRPE